MREFIENVVRKRRAIIHDVGSYADYIHCIIHIDGHSNADVITIQTDT